VSARKAFGLALTVLGIVLILAALAAPLIEGKKYIGDKKVWKWDNASIILAWFLIIIGPAIAYGERPVALERIVRERREAVSKP